jgi:hypothetical protein
MFQRPMNYDLRLTGGTPEEWVGKVIEKLNESETWDNQAVSATKIRGVKLVKMESLWVKDLNKAINYLLHF